MNFQGLIAETDKEFQFIISNLSSFDTIKIDIMKKNIAVKEVDPGAHNHALNSVNEIHALSSYKIKSDQLTNRKMILTELNNSTNTKQLTVEDAELLSTFSVESKPQGTYFYIAVTPSTNNQELINQFKETKWIKNDIIIIKTRILTPQCAMVKSSSFVGSSSCYQQSAEILEEQCAIIDDNYIKASHASQVLEGDYCIQKGYATNISYKYDVSSNITDQLCTICLSISPGLKFFTQPSLDEFKQRANDLIFGILKNEHTKYLDSLKFIYKETNCVICLESNIDSVLYDCGHSCIHSKCLNTLTTCPLCRKHIYAILNI